MGKTVYRQCTLCEAHCGIRVDVEGDRVLRISGDPDDVLSRGYICPKAAALADIQSDPDRLRRPVKKVDGRFVEIGWDEALDLAARGLREVQDRWGADAVATYAGNPSAHSSAIFAAALVRRVLGTKNNYSATSTDQLPQFMSSYEMFGHYFVLPVPDVERTDHMLVIGANPAVSNGSLMTAPGIRDRIKGIRARGGKVVVIDPRRTETAKHASEHVAVRPGGDPYLLLGMLSVIFAEDLVSLGSLSGSCDGMQELRALAAQWPPERAAAHAGVEAQEIARLAREFAVAPSAVAYGRVGVCQKETGSLTHWLINVLNIVTGNMDRPGGAMFPTAPVELVSFLQRTTGNSHWGTYRQRVSGLPEFADELPVAGLADEILTPGEGQVRGMLVIAGNPVLSTPGGGRLDGAMEQLEWCVAVDMYVTETSRHADVILPPLAHLERSDIDIVFPALSVRNQVRYNPAALPAPSDGKDDWEIVSALAARVGRGTKGAVSNTLLRALAPFSSFERIIDAAILFGPYGRLRSRKGLDVGKVKKAKHGIDLGPLRPGLMKLVRTKDKRVRLAPAVMMAEAERLDELAERREAARAAGFDLMLIGRRSLRSNNSWMHNSPRLMKGADRCTALLHPDDAEQRGLGDGQRVRVASTVGSIELPLELSDEIRPGVISIPHGFGHGRDGVGWRVAAEHAGASVNDVTDPTIVDRLTGNAAFNDVPVRIDPVPAVAGLEPALDAVGV
jgi:anaerobic selenocysteine-containing dehydrogenase